ncbi:hypothetical protein CANARDRAFT_20398 [[Candida] arabinofermentans NRRL YB-2248]|uniref:Uncharacterized protein n=1 Tax=[Candida] arabinofermentans NRRL YB-2248 TaxID=983967 RepID=A0A1E4T7B8_9ASCO|nr:hypothetical protein CANARDRAFT_20398 [[Candida] arabinofermentans NRRL YB-2248]
MSNRSKHDVRRQLFRGITTRISSHNHNSSAKDEQKDQMITSQIPLPASQQIQSQTQYHPHQQPIQTSDGFVNAPSNPKTKRSILKRNNIITPTLASKSQTINFTPNSAYSSSSSTSNSTDINTAKSTDKLIIRKDESDLNEYDYKTFSTSHPLRVSKVKAFEQSEMTTRLYFSKDDDFNEDDDVTIKSKATSKSNNHYFKKSRPSSTDNKERDDIVIQVPGMSRRETRAMFQNSNLMNDPSIDIDMDFNRDLSDDDEEYEEDFDKGSNSTKGDPFMSAEKRMKIMKNALRPVSEDQILAKRLKNSELSTVFLNTSEFLTYMDPQELEYWELLNESFEKDMERAQSEARGKNGAGGVQNNISLLDTPLETVYKSMNPELSAMVSDNLRKMIKQEVNDELTINLNPN